MKRAPPPKPPPRPVPVVIGHVRVRVVRGPRQDEDGTWRWYWRAEVNKGGSTSTAWVGWGTSDEVTVQVARTVGGVRVTRDARHTVTDLLELWVASRQEAAASGSIMPGTLSYQTRGASYLIGRIGSVLLERLDRASVERFRDARLREGAATGTVRQEMISLGAAWRWGRETGVCPDRELVLPKLRVETVRDKTTPTRAEIVAVLGTLEGWEHTLIYLFASTGCRLGELEGLQVEQVDLAEGVLTVEGKTGRRRVPLSPPVVRALLGYIGERTEGPMWPYATGTVRIRTRQIILRGVALANERRPAGAPPVRVFTPHGLRRAAVGALYRSGVDVGTAAKVIGHSPSTALRAYRDVTDEDRELAVRAARLGYLDEGEVVDLDAQRRRR